MNTRSDYSFYVTPYPGGAVHIVDQNLGRMSVTNDVENVLAAIHKQIDLTGRDVSYTDSEGQVDSLIHDKGKFIRFAPGP